MRLKRLCVAATLTVAALVLAGCGKEQQQAEDAATQLNATAGHKGAPGANPRAEQLLAQADTAANQGRDAQAHDAYERAVALYRDAGDLAGQGRALLGLATHTRITGQGEVARDIYARAQAAFERAGDELGEAKVAFALAELERARFNNDAALTGFQAAADAFRAHGEWALEAQALLGIADSERRLGQIATADDTIARARAIFEILNDRAGQLVADRTREELLTYVDDNDAARLKLTYDINYADQGGSRRLEAQGNLGMGHLEVAAGHPVQARRFLNEARMIFAEMKLPAGEQDAWAALGNLERRLGRTSEARDAYERAVALFETARNDPSTEARAYAEVAVGAVEERQAIVLATLSLLDAPADAAKRLDAARTLAPPGTPAVDGALAFARAEIEHNAGRPDAALAGYAAAAEAFDLADLPLGAGQALLAHAGLERERENWTVAAPLYDRAIDAYIAARDRIGEGEARFGLAQVLARGSTGTMEANVQYRIAARVFDELGLVERSATAVNAARALR